MFLSTPPPRDHSWRAVDPHDPEHADHPYLQVLLMTVVLWCPFLWGPLASPGEWGLWGTGPGRCLQKQGLREPGTWVGTGNAARCYWYLGLEVLVGMQHKPWDNASHGKASESACKFALPIPLPCLCSLNLLQSSSCGPNSFSKLCLHEQNCSYFRRRHAPRRIQ